MNREFIINLLFLIFANVFIKAFYVFGIELQVQNIVGPEDYGLYFALFNLSFLFQIICDWGIQQYNTRSVSFSSSFFKKNFSALLSLKLCLSVLFFMISILFALIIGYSVHDLSVFGFLILNQALISLTFYFRSIIAGLQFYRTDSLISISDKFILILLCLPFIYGASSLDIQLFVKLQTTAFSTTCILCFLIVIRQYGRWPSFSFSWTESKILLRKSTPFALVVLLMTLYTRTDSIMLERLLGDNGAYQAGIYAAGFRLLDALTMFCFLFAGLLLPMFSKLLSTGKDIASLTALSARMMLTITIISSIQIVHFAEPILQLLYVDYSPDMVGVLSFLLISFNAIGMIQIYGTLLTANQSLAVLNRIFLTGFVINIVLNLALIYPYGATGAALATLFTQSIVAIGLMMYAKKHFDLSIHNSTYLRLALFVLLCYFTPELISGWITSWVLQLILCGFISFILALTLQIIEIPLIYQFIKTKAD
jgi:O-antigen/teichoic acid export membrane protein